MVHTYIHRYVLAYTHEDGVCMTASSRYVTFDLEIV